MSTGNENPKSAEERRIVQAPLQLKLAVFFYLLLGLFFFIYLMLDTWSAEFAVPRNVLGLSSEFVAEPDFQFFMFAAAGGGLGGIIYSVLAFHRHVSIRLDFESHFAWGYFFSPWMATVMGLVAFVLVQSGLLVFAPQGEPSGGSGTDIGYFGFGFLAGFGWTSATEKFRQLVIQIFGRPRDPGRSFIEDRKDTAVIDVGQADEPGESPR